MKATEFSVFSTTVFALFVPDIVPSSPSEPLVPSLAELGWLGSVTTAPRESSWQGRVEAVSMSITAPRERRVEPEARLSRQREER